MCFSMRSFYLFLEDGGVLSPLYPLFWKVKCPSKITLFLANKILTLNNLAKKGCNTLCAKDTCV